MSAPVTERESALCSAEFGGAPTERELAPANGQTVTIPVHSAITHRDRVQSWVRAASAYFTPPAVLTERPASVAELRAYAEQADWTASPAACVDEHGRRHAPGTIRRLGIWWYRLVGLPTTVACRYAEWIAQRPGRAIPVFVLWKLCISSGPGPWVSDNVILPAAHAAAWILL